jgi:hypothetical protein
MRRIIYAGGSFVTSDEIADAVLRFAEELANHNRAATLTVPAVEPDGPTDVEVLVGPASQLMAESIEGEGVPPDGTAFLAEIEERIRQQRTGWMRRDDLSSIDWDL